MRKLHSALPHFSIGAGILAIMNKNQSIFFAVALALAVSEARACEDEHPPAVTTPIKSLEMRVGRKNLLSLAFDPRGTGKVAPAGDDANLWIDEEDADCAWDYREWQWWTGHPWGDSCRPRYYAKVAIRVPDKKPTSAVVSYQIDGFNCRQTFMISDVIDPDAPHWDVVTAIRNASGQDVDEYAQFFACYTPLNRGRSFWYWDESGKLVLFADRGVSHLDGYVAHPKAYFVEQGAIPHCPRGGGKIVAKWIHPMMVSQASPAGWRSVIMVEPQYAAALAQGIQGKAMDYILFPDAREKTFAKDAEFAVHIRHVMLKSPELPDAQRLQGLWDDFQRSHAQVRESASKL